MSTPEGERGSDRKTPGGDDCCTPFQSPSPRKLVFSPPEKIVLSKHMMTVITMLEEYGMEPIAPLLFQAGYVSVRFLGFPEFRFASHA